MSDGHPYTEPDFLCGAPFFVVPPHDGQTIADRRYKFIDRTMLDDNAEPILDDNGNEQRIFEFYDLRRDPYELNNLLDGRLSFRERIRLIKLYRALQRQTRGVSCAEWRELVFGG